MSGGTRIPLDEADARAAALLEELAPHCERIEIAGSIRRRRPSVGDIELVAIPKVVGGPRVDLFAAPQQVSALDQRLDQLGRAGAMRPHPTSPADGDRYKKRLLADGLQLDLFVVLDPRFSWGPIFAIRTGPADYSKRLVTQLHRYRLRCNGAVIERTIADIPVERVPCPDERTFFELAREPWCEPRDRR